MNRHRQSTAVVGLLFAVVLVAGFYFATAGAQNRGHDPAIDPPKPATDVASAPEVAVPPGERPLVQERFDAEPQQWRRIEKADLPDGYGVWKTGAGTLQQAGSESGNESFDPSIFLAPVDAPTRGTIGVQVYPQGNQSVSLVFAANETGYFSYNVLRHSEGANVTHSLTRYDARTGRAENLVQTNELPGYELGRWQELRVELKGDTVVAFFDGKQVFEVQAPGLGRGEAGVASLPLGDVLFDNFIVAQP